MLKIIKNNKTISILILITIIVFIIGLLLPSILDNNTKTEISNNLKEYISFIKQDKINTFNYLKDTLKSNSLLIIIIWLLGISVIGIPLILVLYLSKVLIIGLEITFLIKNIMSYNILFIIIYMIPKIVNLLLLALLVYYSISFSILLVRTLFINKQFNLTKVMIKYIRIFIIISILMLIVTLGEYFLESNLLKYLF